MLGASFAMPLKAIFPTTFPLYPRLFVWAGALRGSVAILSKQHTARSPSFHFLKKMSQLPKLYRKGFRQLLPERLRGVTRIPSLSPPLALKLAVEMTPPLGEELQHADCPTES